MPPRLQLQARTGHPDFLDLPWEQPLEEWRSTGSSAWCGASAAMSCGSSITTVLVYALKELPDDVARHEYELLRDLGAAEMPVVEAVGVVTRVDDALDAVLITRHLDYSLPFRTLFSGPGRPDLGDRLLDAGAELLVRLHLAGFFWGDCSLSNTLFRRDAGALSAYLVDAETGELHETLTDGQREHDLQIAEENLAGELEDVAAEIGRPLETPGEQTAAELVHRYEQLWDELVRDELFGPDERYRLHERLHRLNELGFDVEELELLASDDGYRLRLHPRVVEPGHHRRRLLTLTGLHAQENQARRLLNDLADFRARLELEEGRSVPETIVAYRWLAEVFEPAIAGVPAELYGKREAAEIFHEILEHRWYLAAGGRRGRRARSRGGVVRRQRAPTRPRRANGARGRAGRAVLVQLDPIDRDRRLRPVAGVAVDMRDAIDDVLSGRDAPEHGVLAVEPGACVGGDDEELRAVRVRPSVRHRERAAGDLVLVELVLERVAGTAGPVARRAAALDHEVGDHAVEGETVVVAVGRELGEVLDRLRGLVRGRARSRSAPRWCEASPVSCGDASSVRHEATAGEMGGRVA